MPVNSGSDKQGKKPKLGILLPTRGLLMTGERAQNIETLLSMAETVEQAGLDSVWVGDSLTAKPRLEPLSTLSAVAARTRRVRLGTAVLLPALRHPVLLAHAVGTLDLISEGRTVLGMGVGGAFNESQKQEWRNAGVEPSTRASRFEEVTDITNRLTRGEKVTHRGRHFNLDSVKVEPTSPQSNGVPILIACHWRTEKEVQFQRAARLGDGFISISDYPEDYARLAEKVQGYAEEYGRDFNRMEAAFYMTVNLERDERKAAEEADRFLHLYYGVNLWGDRWGPYGAPERTVERIRQYAEAGAGTIIVRFASFEQQKQLKIFLSEVVPEL